MSAKVRYLLYTFIMKEGEQHGNRWIEFHTWFFSFFVENRKLIITFEVQLFSDEKEFLNPTEKWNVSAKFKGKF